jgi:hypothetical protein
VTDAPCVDLVNLALIHEHNAENVTGCHGEFWGRCYFDADIICPGAGESAAPAGKTTS